MSAAEITVWVSLLLPLYAYFGYPLSLYLLVRLRGVTPPVQSRAEPSVTLLVAAHNEGRVIAQKLDNALAQTYPPERLDVVVVSDGSTDRTDEIVESYAHRTNRVRLLRSGGRRGKSAALNIGMEAAQGEIVVLTDANAVFEADAVARLVASLNDARVGAVSGQLRYRESSGLGSGESAYWRYEQWVKRAESALHSLLGANGSIYAIRRDLFRPLRPQDVNDLRVPYEVLLQGHWVVLEPEAVSFENPVTGLWSQYRRKVRIMARAIPMTLSLSARTLARGRFFTLWQLISHKVLREIQGIFFAAMAVGAAWAGLQGNPFMLAFLGCQVALYLLGAIGWTFPAAARWRPLRLAAHFDMIVLASLAALFTWISGRVKPTWAIERA